MYLLAVAEAQGVSKVGAQGWRCQLVGMLFEHVVHVRARACRMQPNCTEVCGNVDINVRTSSALNGGACKTCGSELAGDMGLVRRVVLVCLQHGIHVWRCGSQFVGNMELAYRDVWLEVG